MKTKNKLPMFTISRRRWQRGRRGKYPSSLYVRENGRMCCLGQVGLQCGYTVKELKSKPTPGSVEDVSKFAKIGLALQSRNTELSMAMMPVNDSNALDDKEREKQLIELAKDHFRLRFVP